MRKLSGQERLAAQKANATQHLLSGLHELENRPVEPTEGVLGIFLGARPVRDRDMDKAARLVRQALNLIAPPEPEPDRADPERSASGQPQSMRPQG